MIHVDVIRMNESGWVCCNPICQHLPEYTVNIFGKNHSIKKGTICAEVGLDCGFEYYCGGCIDEIYRLIKKKLDPNLRAFQ